MKKDNIEETGGELSNIPNEKYKKFFDKFSEIETLEIKDWKIAHILGYFCKKYKDTYNKDYSWKFSNPSPSKCFEVWQANTMSAKLSSDPQILKEYIDWIFLNKVQNLKRRFTSISFLTGDLIINEYKQILWASLNKQNNTISRSAVLPSEYINAFESSGIFDVQTYGDLAFISQMKEMTDIIKISFLKLESLGFNLSVLDKII